MENDLNQTVEKLLSDPEMLAKIKNIASSVSLSQSVPSPQNTQALPNPNNVPNNTVGNSPNNINLKNFSALISSLCPFLDAEKRKRAEHLLELIRLAQTAGVLGNLIK